METLLKSSISLISDLLDLLITEAKLAGKSALVLCVLMMFMLILIASAWLCLLGAVFMLLLSLDFNNISVFLMLAGFNIILVLLMLCLARSYQKILNFQLPEDN